MNGRERLLRVLCGEGTADRVPWAPLIDGYFMSSQPAGTDLLDLFEAIDADVMERHVWTWASSTDLPREPGAARQFRDAGSAEFAANGVTVRLRTDAHPKGTLLTKSYDIPGRTLTERGLFTQQSPYLPFPVEPLIKTVEDLEAYEYIVERRAFAPTYESFSVEDARIGARGIATDSGPTSPIQELLQHTIGIEKFYTLFWTEHRAELESLLRAMHRCNLRAYEVIAGSPAEVVIGYENTSTTYISPHIYREWVSPCVNAYADIVHEREKVFLTHRCGLLRGLVREIRAEHDDGVADVSPPPTGDLPLWEARQAWPEKVVVGGFDATLLTSGSTSDARAYAAEILARCGSWDRLVLGSGDAVPKTARVENLRAVGRFLAEEEGRRGGESARRLVEPSQEKSMEDA